MPKLGAWQGELDRLLEENAGRASREGLRGEDSTAALCRREGIAESLYYP